MALLPRKRLTFSGRVHLASGVELSEEPLLVYVYQEPSRFQPSRLVARGQVGLDGTFALEGFADIEADVSVRFGCRGAGIWARERICRDAHGPHDDLTIKLDLSPAAFTVRDEAGQAIAGARVALAPAGDADTSVALTADQKGEVVFNVRAGKYELTVRHPGYRALVSRRISVPNADGAAERVVLPSLESPEVLEGRVHLADGTPVADAFVTASPIVQDRTVTTVTASAVSNLDGAFHIPADFGAPAELYAFHEKLGFGQEVIDGASDALLQIVRTGELEVEIRCPDSDPLIRSGRVVLVLVDRHRTIELERHPALPIRIRWIPEGSYNLLVYSTSLNAFGHDSIEIRAGAPATSSVTLLPGRWFKGRVVDREGTPIAGVNVQGVLPEWGRSVSKRWASARTTANGKFSLFGGVSRRLKVSLSNGSRWGTSITLADSNSVILADRENGLIAASQMSLLADDG